MAKYLGIPLTVSNGNRIPLTAQPELIPNSDFTSSSGWNFSAGSGASISNNQLTFANSPNNAFASTSTIVLQRGKTYVVKVDIASLTGDNPRIRLTAGGDASTYSPYYTSAGVYTHTFIANASSTNGKIQVYFYSDSTGSALINSVSLKEIAATVTPTYGSPEFVTNGDFSNAGNDWTQTGGWTFTGNKANRASVTTNSFITQDISVEVGRIYEVSYTRTYISGDGVTNLFSNFFDADPLVRVELASYTGTVAETVTVKAVWVSTYSGTLSLRLYGANDFTGSIDDVSIKEVQYNYLQVSNGGFKKSVKEGDVIFNTSTSTEGFVKQVIDNNVLLMSNNNFSTAGELFNVFAANGDTRGNQVVRTDNYIMSEYDENTTNPQETSFWFAGGVNADKVALTQLNAATNTFFVAGVIEEYLERLNAQSATASRLDIPLDAFRDHKNNEVLVTTAITLS